MSDKNSTSDASTALTVTASSAVDSAALAEYEGGGDESDLIPARVDRPFRGVAVGGNTVTRATEHLPEEHRLLVRALHTAGRDEGWEWKDYERETGVGMNALYKVFTGAYRYGTEIVQRHCPKCRRQVEAKQGGQCVKCGTVVEIRRIPHPKAGQQIALDGICEKLRRWKARYDRGFKQEGTFVETSVWQRINLILKRAFKTKKMAFIFGESQIGKTWSAKEYARRNNTGQTSYVDMPPSAGVQLMLKHIALSLHVNAKTCFEKLLTDVTDAQDPSKMLLLDNVHRVFTTYQKGSVMRCLDTLLYIWDTSGCAMGIFATPQFDKNVKEGEFAQYLKQFDRRGVHVLRLEDEPRRCDLDAIAAHYGLEPAEGEAEDIMLEIAHKDGFGGFCTRIQDALELAEVRAARGGAESASVTWDLFVKAHNIALKAATKPAPEKDDVRRRGRKK